MKLTVLWSALVSVLMLAQVVHGEPEQVVTARPTAAAQPPGSGDRGLGGQPASSPESGSPETPAEGEQPSDSPQDAETPAEGAGEGAPSDAPDAAEPPEPVFVRIGGRNIYQVRVGQGSLGLKERAEAIEQAIRKAIDTETPDSVRVETLADTQVIYAGAIPLLHLTAEDAAAAGDASLGIHANRVAVEVRETINKEQQRSAIATTIFSATLAILLALAALLLLRKTSELTSRVRNWVTSHRENIPGIRLQSLEVVDAATIRSAVTLGVEVFKWGLRIGIVYLWLLLTLSLFDSTREYTQGLTGIVLTPLSSLMARVAKSLPMLVVALIAIAALAVLIRFVELFFAGVARGETRLGWLPPDLAPVTSVLLRAGIVLGALVFAAPVVTGDQDDAFGKIGVIALAALGLSSTPVLASALMGVGILYGRKLRVGDFVEFGGRSGRVLDLRLLEVKLEEVDGTEVRVPHLLSLMHSTRVMGRHPRVSIEICVADHSQDTCLLLRSAAAKVGERAVIEVLSAGEAYVRYRVSVVSGRTDVRNALFFALTGALREAGIALGSERQPVIVGVA